MEHRPGPYGYQAERVPHPVPVKAAQGNTKTRLVLDPPRAGVARPVIDVLSAPSRAGVNRRARRADRISRIAYVSCDPATLARDVAALAGSGWTLGALRAFDAFPMTHHVECLATLTRTP